MHDPYHEGARRMQAHLGVRDRALLNGRVVAPAIPERALGFLAEQRLAVVGAAADDGALWAGVMTGPAGFARATADGRGLHLACDAAAEDPLRHALPGGLAPGRRVGMLFIDHATRRRLRVGGTVVLADGEGIGISVAEAFPNCPKFIRQAWLEEPGPVVQGAVAERGRALTEAQRARIATAETFHVASIQPGGGLDVSHRGGAAGFLNWEGDALVVPDYPGNFMFRTLGNLLADPRAGLVFADLVAGRQLQLSGRAEIDLARAAGGTAGRWLFHPEAWVESPLNRPVAVTPGAPSPFNP